MTGGLDRKTGNVDSGPVLTCGGHSVPFHDLDVVPTDVSKVAEVVTSVKVVYEAFCVILFPMIVYTASAIACTSFSASPSMRAEDRSANDSAPM